MYNIVPTYQMTESYQLAKTAKLAKLARKFNETETKVNNTKTA